MTKDKEENSIIGYMRLITPILIAIVGWYVASIKTDIGSIDNKLEKLDSKMFQHLTNDEIHYPQRNIVGIQRFEMYTKMMDSKLDTMTSDIKEIKNYFHQKK